MYLSLNLLALSMLSELFGCDDMARFTKLLNEPSKHDSQYSLKL